MNSIFSFLSFEFGFFFRFFIFLGFHSEINLLKFWNRLLKYWNSFLKFLLHRETITKTFPSLRKSCIAKKCTACIKSARTVANLHAPNGRSAFSRALKFNDAQNRGVHRTTLHTSFSVRFMATWSAFDWRTQHYRAYEGNAWFW